MLILPHFTPQQEIPAAAEIQRRQLANQCGGQPREGLVVGTPIRLPRENTVHNQPNGHFS